ncbi:MAG: hypothetical protein COS85_13790, partial [Armatimonadetes bacterium CG07_land_8_20_14_0_80_59_28]
MRGIYWLMLASVLTSPPTTEADSQPPVLYISTKGDDSWSGKLASPNKAKSDGPFTTLERARDAVRELKQNGGIAVELRGGVYERDTTFKLTAEDAGTAEAPVVYRAHAGEEVRVVGGRHLPPAAFKPVTDPAVLDRLDSVARGKLLQADLKSLGIGNYGEFPNRFRGAAPVLELFFNDQRMMLARWPNDGWAHVAKVVERGSVPRVGDKTVKPGAFEYEGDRPARWKIEDGVWLTGYWCFDWCDEAIRVRSIDPGKRVITFTDPHIYGLGSGNQGPRRYYALNILDELDRPGEYYLDRKTGTLYFWPPAPIAKARIAVSVLQDPLISLDAAAHVTIRGLTLEACRGVALTIKGGREDQIVSCVVRNTGQAGIAVEGGEKHRVEACDIHDTGTLGISLVGGDRKTLTAAGHEAINNHIYRFSRLQRTYASAIQVGGVGNRVAHNLIHDAPHQAIGLSGNDHIIEFNEVHHVIMETDDCGAFYMGRNPSERGTVIRYNFWHHLGSPLGHGNAAIYFDDGDGGQTVYGNVFIRCGEPALGSFGTVFCHGGHDNLIENNIFIECKRAIGAAPWNDRRWAEALKEGDWQQKLLKDVDITKPPYSTRYPELEGYMTPSGKPRMNRAARNVAVMCGQFVRGNYLDDDNFITDKDPGFVDAAKGNFQLKDDSIVYRKVSGFKNIPFEKIGLYRDANRPTLTARRWSYAPPHPLPPLQQARPVVKKAAPPPVFRVARTLVAPQIDGTINTQEWNGADPAKAMVLEQDVGGMKVDRRSLAWLLCDDDALYLGIDSAVNPSVPMRVGQSWGQDDAVEIALSNPAAGKSAPIIILRGFPNGHFESSDEAGAPAEVVKRAAEGVIYKARIESASRWTAEWRIPFSSLGADPSKHTRFAFNLTVRKSGDNLWLMWEGTRARSWEVD